MDKNFSTTRLLLSKNPLSSDEMEKNFETTWFYPEVTSRQGEGGLRTKGYFKKTVPEIPLVTIVTVVYNGEKYLEQTIQSIITQNYDNVEYIIIDGHSSDRTLEIIKKHENQIDYWVSEEDKGIYAAMNKAIDCASGEVIAFLNADDWYEPGTIKEIAEIFSGDKTLDFVFATENKIDENGQFIKVARIKMSEARRLMPLAHPALFIKTHLHKARPFDLSFKIGADYDFVLSILEQNPNYYYIDKPLTNFRSIGISATTNLRAENFRIHMKHFGFFYAIYAIVINFFLSSTWKILYTVLGKDKTEHLKKKLKKLFSRK